MKRRGAHSGGSLFAFQDVMASLIGILFFVVLFMALDIVEQAAPTTQAETIAVDLSELRAKLKQLEGKRSKLEQDTRRVTETLDLARRSSDVRLAEEIKTLNAHITHLAEVIRQADDEQVNLDTRRQTAVNDAVATKAKAKELNEAIRRVNAALDALRKRTARTSRAGPTVTYLLDEGTSLKPWLVEVSGKRIRVAPGDDSGAVLTFSAQSTAARLKQFLAWARSRSNRRYYFVIVTKPSGLGQVNDLAKALRSRGYRLGRDLLPEDWEPFGEE